MRPFPTAAASTARAISTATAPTREIFAALARELPRDAVWVTSNLARTRQTAAAILAAAATAGMPRSQPLAIPDLAEQHLGDWQGLERKPFYAERKVGTHTLWFGPADERPPGGESFVDLVERVRPVDRAPQRRAPRTRHRRRHARRHHQGGAGAGAGARPAGGAELPGRELLAHQARLSAARRRARALARRRRQPPPLVEAHCARRGRQPSRRQGLSERRGAHLRFGVFASPRVADSGVRMRTTQAAVAFQVRACRDTRTDLPDRRARIGDRESMWLVGADRSDACAHARRVSETRLRHWRGHRRPIGVAV